MLKIIPVITFVYVQIFVCQAYNCPRIISREEWGARSAETINYVVFPLDIVIIQHTVTDTCKTISSCKSIMRSIQTFHLDSAKLGDIGYNFLIGGDGNIYEGRGWHKQGAHLRGYNSKSVGIAFIGNFNKIYPTDAAVQAVKNLMACGVELGELNPDYKLYGAKQLSATESPGSKLFNRMMNWDNFAEEDDE